MTDTTPNTSPMAVHFRYHHTRLRWQTRRRRWAVARLLLGDRAEGSCDTCGVPMTGRGHYAGEQAESICNWCATE